MKKVIVTLYPYAELSEAAKAKALTSLADLNTLPEWWDSVYQDAAAVGLKITGFNLMSRNFHSREALNYTLEKTAIETAKLILENHGEGCETYKHAKLFLDNRAVIEKSNHDNVSSYLAETDERFIRGISFDYWDLLQKDYDYRTSKEAIEESIEANEFLFTVDGKVFSTQYEEMPAA